MDRKQLSRAYELLEQARAQQGPGTSAAKSIEPDGLKGTSLENAPQLGQAFERSNQQPANELEAGQGSQQVRESGPANDMRPSPEIAREPDREKHAAEMSRDDQAAKDANYRELMQNLQDRERPQDRDREADELGLG